MADQPQTFENHARFDPLFHFFLIPVALITLIASGVHLYHQQELRAAWEMVVVAAGVVAVFRFRIYSLKLQDRIIRLEERLRLATLSPNEFRPHINELTEEQLVGLRFACDAEVAALAQRAVQEKLSKKDIKKAVTTWRADHWRV